MLPLFIGFGLFLWFLIASDSKFVRKLLKYVYIMVFVAILMLFIWIPIYFGGIYDGGDYIATDFGTELEKGKELKRSKGNYIMSELLILLFISILAFLSYCYVVKYWIYCFKE